MFWTVLIPHLTVSAVFIGLVLRALGRYRRTVDALIAQAKEADAADQRAFDAALVEIKSVMRARVDAIIAEAEKPPHAPSSRDVTVALTGLAIRTTAGALTATVSHPVNNILPTESEVHALPQWARVAFAARCARRVVLLYPLRAFGINPAHRNIVECTVVFAEVCAARASSYGAGATAQLVSSAPVPTRATAGASGAAANACLAAASTSDSARLAAKAARVALNATVAPTMALVCERMWHDFEWLVQFTNAQARLSESPVPPSIFGPLWPEGPPAGWPAPEAPATELIFEFDVPDEMTTAEAVEFVKELSVVLCELDLAGGGHGLAIRPPLEITAPVRSGVRS